MTNTATATEHIIDGPELVERLGHTMIRVSCQACDFLRVVGDESQAIQLGLLHIIGEMDQAEADRRPPNCYECGQPIDGWDEHDRGREPLHAGECPRAERLVTCCGQSWTLAEFNEHNAEHGGATLGLGIGFAVAAAFAVVAGQAAIIARLAPIFEALNNG